MKKFILILTLFTHLLVFSVTPEQIVSQTAATIFNLEKSGKITLNIGRYSLLNEMKKYPRQIELDLPRITKIALGTGFFGFLVTKVETKNRTAEKIFDDLITKISDYVYKENPNLKNKGQYMRLGEFYIAEIVYALSQNFSAPAFKISMQDPLINSGKWGSVSGTGQLIGSFTMSSDKKTLIASLRSEKELINMEDYNQKKHQVIEHKIYFELSTGKVNFSFGHTIAGKEKIEKMPSFPVK